jgi:hypothetical protein
MRQTASLTGLLLITALAAASAQAGDYYKWTDAQGTVHYSQTRPIDHPSTSIRVGDGAPAVPAAPTAKAPVDAKQKAGANASQTALQKANAQALSSNCAVARKNIASLEGHGMVVASGDPDKAHALDPDARAQALADARKEAATYCAHKP